MFTGIVECLGVVVSVEMDKTNRHFVVESPISSQLKIDQSISHNGVCLTVVHQTENTHTVTAIDETLQKTNLGSWAKGTLVNLERCMPAHGRFDGHIVQGHVDQVGVCSLREDKNGSWVFGFEYNTQGGNITVSKGSICINGTSLTVVDSKDGYFSVAIIPYTFENTNFKHIFPGTVVNLEFDIVGKYVQAMLKKRQ